jgi:PAS domain S-box-containing protein
MKKKPVTKSDTAKPRRQSEARLSERKRMEELLHQNEQLLASIYNTVADCIFYLAVESGGQYRFISVNADFLKVTGLSQEMVVGRTVNEVIPEPSLTMVLEKYQQVIDKKTRVSWEETSDYPAGRLTGEVCIAPVFNDKGTCTHLVGSVHDITGRKRMEEEILALSKFLSESPSPILRLAKDGEILYSNKPGMELLAHWNVEIGEKAPEKWRRLIKETLESAKSGLLEEEEEVKGKIFLVTIAPIVEAGYVNLYARDITERKQAEDNIYKSEKKFRAYIECAPIAIFVSDLEGRFMDCNPKATDMLGYEAAALKKMSITTIYSDEDRNTIQRALETLRQSGYIEGEFRVRRGDGTNIWVMLNISVIEGSLGLGYCYDITERKQAEEALRASSQIIEGIINAIPVRVFWKDRNLVFLGCNTEFARDAGFADPKDIIGKDDYQMGWRNEAEAYRRDDRQIIESGCAKFLIEESQTTPAGDTITLLTSKLPLHNSKGEISGVLGTYMDITDRKRAEDQIKKDLKEKEVMLREIHHRVRNNLNVITSLLSLQAGQITDKDQALAAFEESKNRICAMALVHENLYQEQDFSRINLKKFVETMTQNLLQIFNSRAKIDVRVQDLSLDLTNAVPCGLILNELVTNALKHAFRDGSQGLITIDFRTQNDNTYKLTVQDNGVGLPKEIDAARSKSLGLVIVNQLVSQIDGDLKITRGEGIRFQITFPIPGASK